MLGIMLNQDTETIKYKDYKFTKLNKGYSAEIHGKELFFNFLPSEVEQFEIPTEFCSKLQQATNIRVLFEPEVQSNMYTDYIRQELQETFNKPIISALTSESETYSLYQISSCNESSEYLPTIYFKEKDNTTINIENENCLIAESKNTGFLLLRDRIVYCYLGVI